jgi:hypothetical protein
MHGERIFVKSTFGVRQSDVQDDVLFIEGSEPRVGLLVLH